MIDLLLKNITNFSLPTAKNQLIRKESLDIFRNFFYSKKDQILYENSILMIFFTLNNLLLEYDKKIYEVMISLNCIEFLYTCL